MKTPVLNNGVIVPTVTPVTTTGDLDEAAMDRLIDFLIAGRVGGIFVLGTTGEGPSVPRAVKNRLVQRTVTRVAGRAQVYAGIGDTCLADSVANAREYFAAGVDAVVAQLPVYFPLQPQEILAYFESLLSQVAGPLIIYNIPSTTRVSIPMEVVAQLVGHSRLVGMKDSENDPRRLEELIKRFGDRPNFGISIGVGAFMAAGLKLGAKGIVPSVGNLIPDVCQKLYEVMTRGDLADAERQEERMKTVAAVYQRNRTLIQSLAALKGAMSHLGLCDPHVLPPMLPSTKVELESLKAELAELGFKSS